MKAIDRQREIFLNGLAGRLPSIPTRFTDLERLAKQKLSKEAFAYIAGGAGSELTMKNNISSLESAQIVPQMLKNVEAADTSADIFGHKVPAPLLFAPIGVLDLAHPNGEIELAKASSISGIPMVMSNQASTPMELCAQSALETPTFFQLYWSKIDDLVFSFVERAEKCGCSAIFLTLDTTMLGWRTRDLDLAYLPFLYGRGIAQYTSDPVFLKSLDSVEPRKAKINLSVLKAAYQAAKRFPEPTLKAITSKKSIKAVQQFTATYSRPTITWDDVVRLKNATKLPIILKGIQRLDDAQKATDHGVDGIVVSNHGGRQIDGAIGSFEALRKISPTIKGKTKILFDSGIRSGADIFKALAAGADSVLLGRPYAYALALGGSVGVQELCKNIISELELTMALGGCSSIEEITTKYLS